MAIFINIHTHRAVGGIEILDTTYGGEKVEKALYSVGIHPVLLNDIGESSKIVAEIENGGVIAIGESGLDRNSEMGIDDQIKLFEQQIELSERYSLPLIIHCVRAFPELLALHKKFKPVQAWIVHGYNNNREILTELQKHNIYISIGKAVMNKATNAYSLLSEIALDRLFLETDDSDYKIRDIYIQVAIGLKMDVEQLKQIVSDNFKRVFPAVKIDR